MILVQPAGHPARLTHTDKFLNKFKTVTAVGTGFWRMNMLAAMYA
jgi:hypothetical protein